MKTTTPRAPSMLQALIPLLFLLGRAAIGWYLGSSNPASASAYGSMGTIVLALVWIYYAALVVFIGALLTAVVDERAKARAGRRNRPARA